MFGGSKPVVLSGGGKRRKGPPRWLVLLLTGAVAGAAGVIAVQEKLLPPRLSAKESAQLRSTLEQTQQQRQRLEQQLADTTRRLDSALTERKTLGAELEESRRTVEQLRRGLASAVASLPPDPRGGAVQVRAARFKTERGQLLYDVVLSRERATSPRNAVMQLVLAGEAKRGAETTVKLQPVALSLGAFEALSGGLPLPEGFDPRQATVHVLDRPEGKLLAMRVLVVK